MIRTKEGVGDSREILVREALEGLRAYRDAKDNKAPFCEVERLRLNVAALCRAAFDIQIFSFDQQSTSQSSLILLVVFYSVSV